MTHEQKQDHQIKELRKAVKYIAEILEANGLCEPGTINLSEEVGGGPGE